jgi:hypothetical protein
MKAWCDDYAAPSHQEAAADGLTRIYSLCVFLQLSECDRAPEVAWLETSDARLRQNCHSRIVIRKS